MVVGKAILQQLELRRQMMIDCGLQYGFLNEKTIRLSRQLDRLINLYEKQQSTSLLCEAQSKTN